jgi:hypothetical protein
MPVVALFLVSCAAPRAKTPDIGEAEVKQEQKRQRMLVIESNIQDQARLMDVMYDIIKRTTSFCENREPQASAKIGPCFQVSFL